MNRFSPRAIFFCQKCPAAQNRVWRAARPVGCGELGQDRTKHSLVGTRGRAHIGQARHEVAWELCPPPAGRGVVGGWAGAVGHSARRRRDGPCSGPPVVRHGAFQWAQSPRLKHARIQAWEQLWPHTSAIASFTPGGMRVARVGGVMRMNGGATDRRLASQSPADPTRKPREELHGVVHQHCIDIARLDDAQEIHSLIDSGIASSGLPWSCGTSHEACDELTFTVPASICLASLSARLIELVKMHAADYQRHVLEESL
jgi:hypothetical protein